MHAHSLIKENQYSVKRSDKDLQTIFNACFFPEFRTMLLGDAVEPLYTPAMDLADVHTIFYRHDYFSSALHEVAHWCIAGKQRRQQNDYGYWYAPDGRSAEQQRIFEKVEAKPQALEWAFSIACGIGFNVSIDNLQALENTDESLQFEQQRRFTCAVRTQLNLYIKEGFPARAQTFLDKLHGFYNTSSLINPNAY